ncbi:GntR family transcriptional regulator [Bacillus sp. S3]|uniref:GntR family transcriptional regulator n=1 Tax=Bacillus sp. S3 TaxID=486398 RepID=UPI00118A1D42|nr:GntR family transcriptional regulator [Bacillus sp. S3]QCJ44726.1 GntR family transcriptional regulator [Bacillus sp. S3]
MTKTPFYQKVKEDLIEKIENKFYKRGEFIPSESKLEEYYKVSRTTIRSAIRDLVDAGYLTVVRGKGTRVTTSRLSSTTPNIMSFTDILSQLGLKSSIFEMSVKRIYPTEEVAAKLEIPTSEEVIEFYRVRSIEDEAITIHCSYIPIKYVGSYDLTIWEEKQSLYRVLKEDYGIFIQTALDNITAEMADKQMANVLKIKKGHPVLHIERLAYDQNNTIVEFSDVYYRGDRYTHTIITKNNS